MLKAMMSHHEVVLARVLLDLPLDPTQSRPPGTLIRKLRIKSRKVAEAVRTQMREQSP